MGKHSIRGVLTGEELNVIGTQSDNYVGRHRRDRLCASCGLRHGPQCHLKPLHDKLIAPVIPFRRER